MLYYISSLHHKLIAHYTSRHGGRVLSAVDRKYTNSLLSAVDSMLYYYYISSLHHKLIAHFITPVDNDRVLSAVDNNNNNNSKHL